MSEEKSMAVRGYLIHMTHYDSVWYDRKAQEKPFDLALGCDMVKAMAEVGFNMLIIDLADGVEYRSLPELKRHYSVPMADLEKLIACARDEGLEIVPKLNFSKTREPRRDHNYWFRPYNDLPDNDAYWAKAFELIDEVVDVCKPERFFFIGMDEDFQRTPAQYVAVVKTLHADLAKRGLRTVMWSDTLLLGSEMFGCIQKTLAAEDGTSGDIVHTAWDYGPVRASAAGRFQDMAAKGLETWVAPGGNPQHVQDWKRLALATGCSGLVMTAWAPVNESNRQHFMDRIQGLGPIYARPEAPVTELPVVPKKPVVQANMQPTTQPMEDPVLAPNYLGEPLAQTPYLLSREVCVCNWMALGPFGFKPEDYAGDEQQEVVDADSFVDVPEGSLVAQEEGTEAFGVTWRRYTPPTDDDFPQVINLGEDYGISGCFLAYLVAHVHSDRDVEGYNLYVGSDDYAKVWLNGQHVHTYAECPRAIVQDDDRIKGIILQKGWNKLVVKCVSARSGGWGFMLRIADDKNRPLITASKE